MKQTTKKQFTPLNIAVTKLTKVQYEDLNQDDIIILHYTNPMGKKGNQANVICFFNKIVKAWFSDDYFIQYETLNQNVSRKIRVSNVFEVFKVNINWDKKVEEKEVKPIEVVSPIEVIKTIEPTKKEEKVVPIDAFKDVKKDIKKAIEKGNPKDGKKAISKKSIEEIIEPKKVSKKVKPKSKSNKNENNLKLPKKVSSSKKRV